MIAFFRMNLIRVGAISAGLAVAAGAFGAHGLKKVIDAAALEVWKTGVQYHLAHALAMLLVAALAGQVANPERIGKLFLAGQLIFAGSLYLLAVTGIKWLGAITPLGGVCFLVGWGYLALSAGKLKA
jgi:uncharacterized membrane protein YgdD (TMEM256/DUF423 family)